MAAGGGTKAIIAAFFANLGIAIAKFIAFGFTRSSSMLAEAIHSVADTGNQGLLMLGGRLARREADDRFQFGFGRERYFWSFIVALVLFSIGSLFAIYEGIEKIRHPHEIESPIWAFLVLGIAIVLEAFSFRVAVRESRPLKGQATWWNFVRHARIPELPVVLLEDLGAMIGLIFAFASVTIAVVFDAPVWDGIGTLAIGLLLGVIAVVLAIEMRSLLLGESATPANLEKIRAAIVSSPGVVNIIHLRTQHLGPEELLVGAKVAFDPDLDVKGIAAAINEVERRVREQVPMARPMYVEPDVFAESVDQV
ncbi:MAG: cation transporter [bacterium]|nr:cation transporter [bacterium]